MLSKYWNINWKCKFHLPCSCSLSFLDNEKRPDRLPCISTRRRRVFHVEIRCFPATFPSLADSPTCRKSFATRSRASIVSQGAIRTATAGWATCPPQSRQYCPSLSVTSGERQNVRRKATKSSNSARGETGIPVKGEHTRDRIPFNFLWPSGI